MEKISGPLLDRIDLHVNVPSVEYDAIRRRQRAESSAAVREPVCAARPSSRRFQGTDIACNAQMTAAMIGQFCRLDSAGESLMRSAFDRMGLTAGPTTGFCGWHGPSPIWTGKRISCPNIWRKPFSIGIRTSCGG